MKEWPPKDPDELLRNTYDWAPDLAVGETLVSGNFGGVDYPFVDPVVAAGTVVEAEQQDDSTLTLIISGGTDGEEAAYTIRVRTSNDQIFEDMVLLPIAAKVVPVMHPGGFVEPTPGNLVALFPEFGRVTRQVLEFYLTRAGRVIVSTAWPEGDFAYARMLLAAHYLVLAGQGTSAQATALRDGSGEFRSMSIGSLSLSRFDNSRSTASLKSTRFGVELHPLLRAILGGPRVTGGLTLLRDGDGDHFGPWTQ